MPITAHVRRLVFAWLVGSIDFCDRRARMFAKAERFFRINADDFGWTEAHNRAVKRAAGVLTHASLMACGDAVENAALVASHLPGLSVGAHLQLCEGQPLTRALFHTDLTQPSGAFYDGLSPLLASYLRGRLPLSAIEAEWRAQIERLLRLGLKLSHLDGHKHVHILPPLLSLTCRLARVYEIPYVRTPLEKASGRAVKRLPGYLSLSGLAWLGKKVVRRHGLQTADHFTGFSESGRMTEADLLSAIVRARPGLTEIMVHPADEGPELAPLRSRFAFANRYQFSTELSALLSPQVARALSHTGTLLSPTVSPGKTA